MDGQRRRKKVDHLRDDLNLNHLRDDLSLDASCLKMNGRLSLVDYLKDDLKMNDLMNLNYCGHLDVQTDGTMNYLQAVIFPISFAMPILAIATTFSVRVAVEGNE